MFQDVYLRMEHGNRNCYKDVRQILCRIQLAIIPLTVVLLSQQAKKQFLVSTYQKADDDAIVKTRTCFVTEDIPSLCGLNQGRDQRP